MEATCSENRRAGLADAAEMARLAAEIGYPMSTDADLEVQQVGGWEHLELWMPAEEIANFNRHIVGLIRVVREYGPDGASALL